MISRLGEGGLQVELLGDEAEEAGGPGVGPGVAWLGTSYSEADDPDPGVAGLVPTGDLVGPGDQRTTGVSLTRVLAFNGGVDNIFA